MTLPPAEQSAYMTALPGVKHGFFGRREGGGQSDSATAPGLNVSETLGHDPICVARNRCAALTAIGMADCALASAAQIHSNKVLSLTAPLPPEARPRVDGFVTNVKGLALAVITADCSPVLFADYQAGTIGACHAGWQGAVDGIMANTVTGMIALGASPINIVAAIGPTISWKNYEVGSEFAQAAIARNANTKKFLSIPDGKSRTHFDLPGFVRAELDALGIKTIRDAGGCTYASPQKYFSHRHFTHNGGTPGRQVSLIAMPD